MANYRDRSAYDLALSTNTHTRIQTGLQLANLGASVLNWRQSAKNGQTLQEISRGIEAQTHVINASVQSLIENDNRNATDAARQRYSQWVSGTDDGQLFHY